MIDKKKKRCMSGYTATSKLNSLERILGKKGLSEQSKCESEVGKVELMQQCVLLGY